MAKLNRRIINKQKLLVVNEFLGLMMNEPLLIRIRFGLKIVFKK